ncbi:MAG: tetratricopeptide repeat protein [Hyphomicrobiales bacterium]|nr:tetratricopeptide repeat protein [Hyphomicrobiales bacterium]MCP5370863.1 tetratricopeptide repeat protein [Hyphomicrobiales bacterium]
MTLALQLFGKFRLTADGRDVPVRSRKGQALLAYLALNGERAQPREHLATLLWGDRFDDQARRSLRQCVFGLRKDLGDDAEALRGEQELSLGLDRVDVRDFENLLAEGLPASLERAVTLEAELLLAGFAIKAEAFDDWLERERRRLRALAGDARERLARYHLEDGDFARAAAEAGRLMAFDPLREEGVRLAMRAAHAAGRRAEALKLYDTCAENLRRDLATEPEPATTRLRDAIRDGAPPAENRPDRGLDLPGASVLPRPERISIAVLPFTNLSGDVEQDLFAEGIAHDVNLSLSHVQDFFVVSYQSSLVYKDRLIDLRQVGQDLNVRYVLQGSARIAGERVRVSAGLTDTKTGQRIWGERYDRALGDLFALQDDLTREMVTALTSQLLAGEFARLWLRSTDNFEAWFYALKGSEMMTRWTPATAIESVDLLARAVDLDPDFADAWALLGFCYLTVSMLIPVGTVTRKAAVEDIIERLFRDGPPRPRALMLRGWNHIYQNRHAEAAADMELAVAQTPRDPAVRFGLGFALCGVGRFEEAEQHVRESIRLNPNYPIGYAGILARTLFEQGKEADGLAIWEEIGRTHPDHLPIPIRLAAEYALAGRLGEARAQAAEVLRIDPEFRIATAAPWYQSVDPKWRMRLLEGLRVAGLPE